MEDRKITKKDIQFGRKMQRIRKKSGLTQEKLADLTKISTTFIGLIETGKRRPSMKTLQKISSALGVQVKDLIPFSEKWIIKNLLSQF